MADFGNSYEMGQMGAPSGNGMGMNMGNDPIQMNKKQQQQNESMTGGFTYAVVVFLLAFLFLAGIKPQWVMKRDESDQPTDEVDYWRVFFGAIFLAIIVGLIMMLFSSPKNNNNDKMY